MRRPDLFLRPLGKGLADDTPRCHLRWPVTAYRVRFKEAPRTAANVLERVVLRLAMAGAKDGRRVAEMTGLAPELVVAVAQGLVGRGWLESDGDVTDAGRAALTDEDGGPDPDGGRLGWVFRCDLTGRLLPALLHGDLPQREPRWSELGEFPVKKLDPRPRLGEPGQTDLLRAAGEWRHLRTLGLSEDLADVEEPDQSEFPLDVEERVGRAAGSLAGLPADRLDGETQHERVSVEPGVPAQPFHLLILAYVPLDRVDESRDFAIRHPLGMPGGGWFKHRLAEHNRRVPGQLAQLEEWALEARLGRLDRLEQRGVGVNELPDLGRLRAQQLFGDTGTIDSRLVEPLNELGKASVMADVLEQEADQLVRAAGAALEVLLSIVHERWGRDRAWDGTMPGSFGTDDGLGELEQAVERLGLRWPHTGLVPITRRDVSNLHQGRAGLGVLISITVLEADQVRDAHPFSLAVRDVPALLEELGELRRWRNWVAHGQVSKRDAPAMPMAVERQVRVVGTIGPLLDACREAAVAEKGDWQLQL